MTEEQLKAIKAIAEAAEILGWQIILDTNDEDVKYILIADSEVADDLVDKLEK